MLHRVRALPALLALLVSSPSLADEAAVVEDPAEGLRVEPVVVTLDNGLRVVVERQDRTDDLAVHLHVGVGARDEGEGEGGLAHLFEHLMYEGSEHAPGNAYDELVTGAGGENNAFTTYDETAYYATVPSGGLERMLFLESDRLGHLRPGLTDEAVANQIDVVIQERESTYATASGADMDTLDQLLYPPGHPYHDPILGTVEDVRAFDVDSARDFHARWYVPSNAILGLVGNIEPDEAIARVRHWFSDVPAAPAPERAAPDPLPRHDTLQRGLLATYADDTTVYVSWYGPSIAGAETPDPDDEAALFVASWLLSDGRGTRLDRHYYRSKRITDADTRLRSRELDGSFVASLSTDRWSPERLERIVLREVRRLVRRAPSDAELERAKASIRGLMLDRMEDPADRAEVLVDCLRHTGTPGCAATEWARIDAVTADDVVGALERLGEPDAILWAIPSIEAPDHSADVSYVEPL